MILDLYSQNIYLFGLLCALIIVVLVQLLYHWVVYSRLFLSKDKNDHPVPGEGVSVVIFSRNQYFDLVEKLPLFFQQEYPEFEVIVINFESEDETQELLQRLSYEQKNLKPVLIEKDYNFYAGKKFPVSIAVLTAKYDICLFTDASCIPDSPQWIRSMVSKFDASAEIVLGYSTYQRAKGMLNRFVRFDNLRVAMNYFGFAMAKMPFSGIGKNFAYRKSLFLKHQGLISNYRSVAAGEDDTFINKAGNRKNTRCQYAPESYMISDRNLRYGDWFRLKRHYHASAKHYKSRHRFMLSLCGFTRFLVWGLSIALLALWFAPLIALGAFAVYLISELIVYYNNIKRLKEDISVFWVPFFELYLMFLQPVLVLKNLFHRPRKADW